MFFCLILIIFSFYYFYYYYFIIILFSVLGSVLTSDLLEVSLVGGDELGSLSVEGAGCLGLLEHLADLDEDLDKLDLGAPGVAEDPEAEAAGVLALFAYGGVEQLSEEGGFGGLEGVLLGDVEEDLELTTLIRRAFL